MKKVVFLFVIFVFAIYGCGSRKPNDDVQVVIFLKPKTLSNSILKSTASEAEKSIQKIVIFGSDDHNKVEKLEVIQSPPSNGIELTVSKDLTTFYVIANPSPELEAMNPLDIATLNGIIADFTNAPQTPLLMSGKAEVTGGKFVHIELTRAVAKIEIIGLNDFVIQTATVMNTPDKGYVFDRGGTLPFVFGVVSYPQVSSANPILYVAENTAINPTTFRLTGTFEGKQAEYDVVLKIGGNNIAILRNNHYQVSITPKTEYDYEITITIPDWTDVKTDDHTIPDENFED